MSKWLREDAEAGDEAFFHCMHDDGDEEDLDEEEAVRGVLATTYMYMFGSSPLS